MTNATLGQRGNESGSHWARRTVLVTFCVLLLGTLGVAFTRVIAERVPEQRATLEKLITDRTGLAVRFDNVHFAWNLDGTSAVFERVELTDPVRGRVRVVAPELRVEFDTWNFLRHHQFSLGHVTLKSPDIEIIGDPEGRASATGNAPAGKSQRSAQEDEAALVRRFTAWAELMPNGRIEVEGARVHLLRRGDRGARNTFTLSQAVVSRSASTFNAFGTMLLSQDVGQSLFLSAKLEGLAANTKVSGDLRLIARRVFLHKLPMLDAKGRGTLDATVHLQQGLIKSASWRASARELELGEDLHGRFDHFTVNGKLERNAGDFLLHFADLQLTRGARLERSPKLSARLTIEPGTLRIARTRLTAERVPFMAAEFLTGLFAPQLDGRAPALAAGWTATAGELRALRFDSRDWTFSAHLKGAELLRPADDFRIVDLAARLQYGASELRLTFDPEVTATLRMAGAGEARPLNLGGQVVVLNSEDAAAVRFEAFDARSGTSSLTAQGQLAGDKPLMLTVAQVDRALLQDGWTLLAPDREPPALLADIKEGSVVEGVLNLRALRDATGKRAVNWQGSTGTLEVAGLVVSGEDLPRLDAGRGTLEFARGNTQLKLSGGDLDQLAITSARVEWPRKGAPRLRASLRGDLAAPLLRRALQAQGLERLAGAVAIEAEARGEKELRQPDLWRVTAQISDASIPLGGDLPPVEKLAGQVRYGNGELRSLALEGSWLGGPVEIASRRPAARGSLNISINGTADATPLLRLLGQDDVANRVSGRLSWTGSAQRPLDDESNGAWQVSLASNLAGVESQLPAPFDKVRARAFPVSAQLRVDARGIHDFNVDGRDIAIRGVIDNSHASARFDVKGVAGELRRVAGSDEPQLRFERLDLKRAPAVLAVAAALLPADGELPMSIDDMHYAGNSLGALRATLARGAQGVEFTLESQESAPHQIFARGLCANANGSCRIEFTADTHNVAALLHEAQLPVEWPTETLKAAGELTWPVDAQGDLTRILAGRFDLSTQGRDRNHQLFANATLADGQIELANVQGTGPDADQIFRGSGRVGLMAREYDLTVDYEQVSLAATAVPTPARARLARAWTALRGSAARRGWTEAPEARRVQWHGTWDAAP
jgi:hypothetical protein